MSTERTYRFAAAERSTWLLGLGAGPCLLVALGLLLGTVVLQAGAPASLAAVPVAVCGLGAFLPWRGRPAHEQVGVAAGWAATPSRRRPWTPPLPGHTRGRPRAPLALPPVFGDLELVEVDGPGAVRDRASGALSATVAINGTGFALADRGEQDRTLGAWGDVLGGFCAEDSAVARVSVSHWLFPGASEVPPGGGRAYRELVALAAAVATTTEILLTVTVDPRRVRTAGRADRRGAAAAALVTEFAALVGRLEAAGLTAGAALDRDALARAVRARLDPTRHSSLQRPLVADHGKAAQRLTPTDPAPLAFAAAWDQVRVDGSTHLCWWVASWPRTEVGPGWIEPLLATPGLARGLVLVVEPVAPSAARRRIDRDATRLATDATQRAEKGFRVGARHRKAEEAVVDREAELVAGFAEVAFTGLVVVSAGSAGELAGAASRVEGAAATVGVELRRLDGRHDLGLAAALPLGRPVAPPRLG